MFRATVAAALALVFGTAATAEVRGFDCERILEDIATRSWQGNRLSVQSRPGSGPFGRRDPVSLAELEHTLFQVEVGQETPAQSRLYCATMAGRFLARETQTGVWATLSGRVDGGPAAYQGDIVPFLLLGNNNFGPDLRLRDNVWGIQHDYNIPINAEPGEGDELSLPSGVFRQGPGWFGPNPRLPAEAVRLYLFDRNQGTHEYLQQLYNIDTSSQNVLSGLVVLCVPTCEELLAPYSGDPVAAAGPAMPATDMSAAVAETLMREPPVAPAAEIEPAFRLIEPSPVPVPGLPDRRLFLEFSEGNWRQIEALGALCLLDALGARLENVPPGCAATAQTGLVASADRNGVLTITVRTLPQLAGLSVTLPDGYLDGAVSCTIDAVYQGEDRVQRSAPLDPSPGTPGVYAASLTVPPMTGSDGRVALELRVNDAADCGGPSRSLSFEVTGTSMAFPLVDSARRTWAVAHVLAANARSLETDVGLGAATAQQLVEDLAQALLGAHAALAAQAVPGRPWALDVAHLGSLTTDGYRSWAELAGAELRQADRVPASVLTGGAGALALRPEFFNGLSDGPIASAAARGSEMMRIALYGTSIARSISGLQDPCASDSYSAILERIAQPGGPALRLAVYPIVALQDGDRINLSAIVPTDLALPRRGQMPYGLHSCLEAPDNLAIYPYFVAPWMRPEAVGARYSLAVSDHATAAMADLLED